MFDILISRYFLEDREIWIPKFLLSTLCTCIDVSLIGNHCYWRINWKG